MMNFERKFVCFGIGKNVESVSEKSTSKGKPPPDYILLIHILDSNFRKDFTSCRIIRIRKFE